MGLRCGPQARLDQYFMWPGCIGYLYCMGKNQAKGRASSGMGIHCFMHPQHLCKQLVTSLLTTVLVHQLLHYFPGIFVSENFPNMAMPITLPALPCPRQIQPLFFWLWPPALLCASEPQKLGSPSLVTTTRSFIPFLLHL